jgi:hypothetical protein
MYQEGTEECQYKFVAGWHIDKIGKVHTYDSEIYAYNDFTIEFYGDGSIVDFSTEDSWKFLKPTKTKRVRVVE